MDPLTLMNADGQGRDRTGDLPLQMAAGIVLLVGSVGLAQEELRRSGVRQGISETSQRLLMDRRLHDTCECI